MTEAPSDNDDHANAEAGLQARLEKLERESRENSLVTEKRLIFAELKLEAMRANMIDLDGLQFVEASQLRLEEDGNLAGGADVVARLKRAKPWLFAAGSSSSIAKVPPSGPTRQKLAQDMSDEEYRVARANIIKRSGA